MIGQNIGHCEVVSRSLSGSREVDEQSLASLEILGERLERLKRFGGLFRKVSFSTAARKMKQQKHEVAVG
ncbi:MAG: hypothetical protein ACYTEL_24515 [Planctomycetota bacterium]|jgi:hypothetical protein